MSKRLRNKVSLITGGGSGIGEAAAMLFAAEGARIGVLDDNIERAQHIADEIIRWGGQAMALAADVGDPKEVSEAIAEIIKKWKRLDIVFANAGINGTWAPIEELATDEWEKTISTNLTGTFLTIKYAVPHLKKRGGAVVITSSVNGTRIFSNSGATAYSCSKAGQLAMGQMLALELARDDIRVNVICPGSVETNISQSTTKRHVEKVQIKAKYETSVPLSGASASAKEIAQLALFLVADESRHITGTPIWIDGAQSLLRG